MAGDGRVSETLRLALFGVGAIGVALAQEVRAEGHEIVAAVDTDPGKVGRDLAEVAHLGDPTGITVAPDLRQVLPPREADVVLHCATSYLWEAHPQLAEAALTRCDVVSTCEELAYPWRAHRHLAHEVDQAAQREGVTILGTGVNPGFVMDVLPLTLSSMCREVERVTVERVVDLARRREPLQRKVGVGLPVAEFEARVREGQLGHVGTEESIDMIAAAFGWNLSEVHVSREPVVASHEESSGAPSVSWGHAAGLRQVGRGRRKEETVIELVLEMAMDAPHPHDRVRVRGRPPIDLTIDGGIDGDQATVAAVMNALPRVMESEAGLKTMLDLPPPSYVESAWRRD